MTAVDLATRVPADTASAPLAAIERRHGMGFVPKRDVALVRGEAARVWDADGVEYLDLTSAHGVAALGHAHPRVADAVAAQARALVSCQDAFPNDVRAAYLSRLARFLPGEPDREPDRVFLCNSGTEAVEAALKLARLSTGRTRVLAARGAFHGRTMGSLSATWRKEYREGVEPLVPHFEHVAFNDAGALDAALTREHAAVLLEVVQGEGGVHAASADYLRRAREMCDERGALLILDEVQTGFGRTGRRFACERRGVAPDLLCMGKTMAGGVPMGGVAVGPRVAPPPPGSHGSTFGGNPLACAAALATLDVVEAEGLVERSDRLGASWLEELRAIDSRAVREVRGEGLMIAMELRARVAPVLDALARRGVLALSAGPRVLRFLPPLVVERDQLDRATAAVAASLDECFGGAR